MMSQFTHQDCFLYCGSYVTILILSLMLARTMSECLEVVSVSRQVDKITYDYTRTVDTQKSMFRTSLAVGTICLTSFSQVSIISDG